MTSTPTNGNVLIMMISIDAGSYSNVDVSSITETGVTWNKVVNCVSAANSGIECEIWLGVIGSSASKNVTVNLNTTIGPTNQGEPNACILEFSGVATTSYTDKTATNTGGTSGSTISTGTTATTTMASELWIGVCGGDGNTAYEPVNTPTNSFTLATGIGGPTACEFGALYYIASAEGAASTGVTVESGGGGVDDWEGCIATFFAAASSTNINLSDTGSGSDAVAVTANVPVTDSGSGSDAIGALKASVTPSTDTGSGSDAVGVQAQIPVVDAGSGADSIVPPQVKVPTSDSGTGSDSVLVGSPVPVSDSGSGTDAVSALQVQVPITDAGSGSDVISALRTQIPVTDIGVGTDSALVGNPVDISDSGSGSDALASVNVQVPVSDAGFGFDSLLAYSLAGALVGYWAFEEGLGSTVHDMSGNGNNGTLEGSPLPSWVAGRFQYALQFTAANSQYVSLGSQNNFPSGASARTVSAWVYLASYPSSNDEGVFAYGADVADEFFSLSISPSGYIYLNVVGSNNTFFTSLTVPFNEWVFIAVVYDGTTNVTGYVATPSGIQSQALTIGSALSTTISGSNANIGLNQNTGTYFTGVISEVRLYNAALSAAQVSALYNLSPLSITAQIPLSDSGSGADSAVVGSPVNVSDSGSGSDVLTSINAQVPVADVGLGTDALSSLQAQVPLTDSGSGADFVGSLQVKIPLSEPVEGSDSLIIAFPISLSDSVVGTDTIILVAARLATHAIIVQSEKGTVTLQTEKGQVMLQSDSD
jgi:hypothetical protein